MEEEWIILNCGTDLCNLTGKTREKADVRGRLKLFQNVQLEQLYETSN